MPATIRIVAPLLVVILSRYACCDPTSPTAPTQVLIVTGEDEHHDWRKTTPVLQQLLQNDPRLQVSVLRDLKKLESTDLQPFGSIIIHFKNTDPLVPGQVAFDNLRQYVRDGGGLVLVHFACGAFEEFKHEYQEMVGRVWMGSDPPPGRRQHDARGPFRVEIADAQHPITDGLSDFVTDDELYSCLVGDAGITVLASAISKVDGRFYPMAFLHRFGEGRVFNCTLGHDDQALLADGVGELYRRGCAWSAGLTPRPEEPPSATGK